MLVRIRCTEPGGTAYYLRFPGRGEWVPTAVARSWLAFWRERGGEHLYEVERTDAARGEARRVR